MRILLVALNAKYVHTNLALRYLRARIRPQFSDVALKEFTINEPLRKIAGEIFENKADVVGFSCYIWNIGRIAELVGALRLVCPRTRFVLGGPEVSYDPESWLKQIAADGIVLGEGEETFAELLSVWQRGEEPERVSGLAWRQGDRIRVNPARPPTSDLSSLPLPYEEDEDLSGRLAYVETARGCPFQCQYCLSSAGQGVRYLEAEHFRRTFRRLLTLGVQTVKLVDRTFNANQAHAFRILDIAREEAGRFPEKSIRTHCEMAGELLDEEWYRYLAAYPQGALQLEIGVQSTNPPTLQAIQRPQRFDRWRGFVRKLRLHTEIPLHLDLIAGLPLEGWAECKTSFNDTYALLPQRLQLGFLKLLKGSGLYHDRERWGLIHEPQPPYTVMQTPNLSYQELIQLERIEDLVEKYYNTGKFFYSLREAVRLAPTPFDFYHEFALFWQEQGWFKQAWRGKELFSNLWRYCSRSPLSDAAAIRLREALRFDYYRWERPGSIPEFMQTETVRERKGAAAQAQWLDLVPEGRTLDRRRWSRVTEAAGFAYDVSQENGELREVWFLFFYGEQGVRVYCKPCDELEVYN
ncbi:MAG: B12-binding domain-containing radical SAM protein [Peptococcaceae bacterium]|nr:B12-binding domain-containing radical SAM protein [Peptococcaceae bacterium]